MVHNCFRLTAALFLAATGLLLTAVAESGYWYQVITTCESRHGNVHHLDCGRGVINVTANFYGRANSWDCAEGKSDQELANTTCSQQRTMDDELKTRCDVKRSCELDFTGFRTPDPCVGTAKYRQTTFACQEPMSVVACQRSVAHLYCAWGHDITIDDADYGCHDHTTCSYGRPLHQLQNVTCMQPTATALVAQMCNGKSWCSVTACDKVFQDPCVGTFKYLGISYGCERNYRGSR